MANTLTATFCRAFPSMHPSSEEEDEAEIAVAPVEELATVDLEEEFLESMGMGTT